MGSSRVGSGLDGSHYGGTASTIYRKLSPCYSVGQRVKKNRVGPTSRAQGAIRARPDECERMKMRREGNKKGCADGEVDFFCPVDTTTTTAVTGVGEAESGRTAVNQQRPVRMAIDVGPQGPEWMRTARGMGNEAWADRNGDGWGRTRRGGGRGSLG